MIEKPTGRSDRANMVVPQVIVISVLLITPWCYGGVYESTQVLVFVAMVIALLAWLVPILRGRSQLSAEPRLTAAAYPLLLAIAFGAFQLLPLPRIMASVVSPHGVQLREQLLPSLEPSSASNSESERIQHKISLRPSATRYDLSLLVLALAAFFLGAQLFGAPSARLWLCGAVAINGACLAFFGIVQRLTWNGRMFWIGPEPSADRVFATFANRNNAGGYLNLCLAAAIVLVYWAFNKRPADETAERSRQLGSRQRYYSARAQLGSFVSDVNAQKLSWAILAAVIIGGVLCTFSRGAGIGLLSGIAIATLAVTLTYKGQQRIVGGLLVVLAGIGLVGWVGMHDALVERFETLGDTEQLVSQGRVPNWKDAVKSVPDFWPAGSGLGTYRDIYLLYQERFDTTWYYYAENQYLQALVEGGLPALLLLLAQIALVALATGRLLKRASTLVDYAFAVGLVFALTSQVVHAFFDFGLYLPSNMLLLAVLCGALVGTVGPSQSHPTDGTVTAGPARLGLGIAITLGLLLGGWHVRSVAATHSALTDADFSTSLGGASEGELRGAIVLLQSRSSGSTGDAELHYQLAKAWIQLYRVHAFTRLRRSAPPTEPLESIWQRASTTELHRRAHELARQGKTDEIEALRNELLVKGDLHPALEHLLIARRACPILSKTHLRLARIACLAQDPDQDGVHVRNARDLAPSDAYTFAEGGLLDLQAGRIDQACSSWRRCLELSSEYFDDIMLQATPLLDLQTIVQRVLPNDPAFLLQLARSDSLQQYGDNSQEMLVRRAEEALPAADLPEDERHYLQALLHQLAGRSAAALDEYGKAVKLRPTQLQWRHEYGKLLMQEGRWDEARQQIRRCAQRDPTSAVYRKLLEQIHAARLGR